MSLFRTKPVDMARVRLKRKLAEVQEQVQVLQSFIENISKEGITAAQQCLTEQDKGKFLESYSSACQKLEMCLSNLLLASDCFAGFDHGSVESDSPVQETSPVVPAKILKNCDVVSTTPEDSTSCTDGDSLSSTNVNDCTNDDSPACCTCHHELVTTQRKHSDLFTAHENLQKEYQELSLREGKSDQGLPPVPDSSTLRFLESWLRYYKCSDGEDAMRDSVDSDQRDMNENKLLQHLVASNEEIQKQISVLSDDVKCSFDDVSARDTTLMDLVSDITRKMQAETDCSKHPSTIVPSFLANSPSSASSASPASLPYSIPSTYVPTPPNPVATLTPLRSPMLPVPTHCVSVSPRLQASQCQLNPTVTVLHPRPQLSQPSPPVKLSADMGTKSEMPLDTIMPKVMQKVGHLPPHQRARVERAFLQREERHTLALGLVGALFTHEELANARYDGTMEEQLDRERMALVRELCFLRYPARAGQEEHKIWWSFIMARIKIKCGNLRGRMKKKAMYGEYVVEGLNNGHAYDSGEVQWGKVTECIPPPTMACENGIKKEETVYVEFDSGSGRKRNADGKRK